MAVKYPRLCVSHTVRADNATIRVKSNTPTNDATTAALTIGVYWTDPVYGTALVSSTSPCLLGAVAAIVDASAAVVGTVGKAYSTASSPAYRATFNCASGDFSFDPTHAGSTTAGREILRRLGCDLGAASDNVTSGNARTMPFALGVWDPVYAEVGDTDEAWDGYGGFLRTVGGQVYTSNLGNTLARRLVAFGGLSGSYTQDRPSDGLARYGFARIIWPYLAVGERVRYYADRSAVTTYLTSAMTTTTATAAVADRTGISANDVVCIDGEWVTVTASGSGAGNLTVQRDNPVAHSANDPVAKDFVGTYVLDEGGGEVNRKGFAPKRRAVNQDRWDFEIPLVRVLT